MRVLRGITRTMLRQGAVDRPIEVISFDLDDTIWHCQPVLERAAKSQHEQLIGAFPTLEKTLQGPKAFSPFFGRAFEKAQQEDKAHDFTWMRRIALEMVADEAGLNKVEVVDVGYEAFIAARSQVMDHVFPGVLDTLKRLREQGFTLVSLTNGNCDMSRVPELSILFDFHVSAISAGAAKPDPRPFQQVMQLTGVTEPSKVLHVGDSIQSDVQGAKAFGMRTIWVNKWNKNMDGKEHGADEMILCVSAIEPTIEKMLGA